MVRDIPRLLIEPGRLRQGPELPLANDQLHYLQRVLRLRDGGVVAVVDGAGHLWHARLQQRQLLLQGSVEQPLCSEPRPVPQLRLAVAMPRRDADVLLRMVTELGVDAVQPLLTARSVPGRWSSQRGALIVREAIEQCERLWAPALAQPLSLASLLQGGSGLRLWATTRSQGLPSLEARLDGTDESTAQITLAIGPEGGWTPAEEAEAIDAGWQPLLLGPTILRCSTAAVAAVARLVSWRSARFRP